MSHIVSIDHKMWPKGGLRIWGHLCNLTHFSLTCKMTSVNQGNGFYSDIRSGVSRAE